MRTQTLASVVYVITSLIGGDANAKGNADAGALDALEKKRPASTNQSVADARSSSLAEAQQTYSLVNGQWFDGNAFVKKNVYVIGPLLSMTRPSQIEKTIDLAGGFVVPPFGEAHHHTLAYRTDDNLKFIRDGVFYVKIQAVEVAAGQRARTLFNKPDTVDLSLAMAGITAPNAHPVQIGLRLGRPMDQLDGTWVHLIESRPDIEKKWAAILSTKPDFLKVFLLNSDEYEQLKEASEVDMRYRGMDPKLVSEIVRRAHAAKLRVSAHVRTGRDFHHAVIAGVDEMTHTPGFSIGPSSKDGLGDSRLMAELDHPERFFIDAQDAALAQKRGVVVITTLGTLSQREFPKRTPSEHLETVRKSIEVHKTVHRHNMRLLKESGVKIAVGSDRGEGSVVDDVFYLASLGVFDNDELLRMWCETTAHTIFPNRKIGLLRDGYEASFLVLERNPLSDIRNVRSIVMRFKQGRILVVDDKR